MPLLTKAPPMGYSNWGTGVQPMRRTTADINQLADSQAQAARATPSGGTDDLYHNVGAGQVNRFGGRNLGTLSPATARPMGRQLNPMYDESQDPTAPVATRAAPSPRSPFTRAPTPAPLPSLDGLDGFARSNTLTNAGVYDPGSFGASNAAANGTGRAAPPPQQTERANPLTGDNNLPLEGQTTAVQPSPFVQRGAGVPMGQDSRAPGTPNFGGNGLYRRSFNTPAAAGQYGQYVRAMFP